MNEFIIRRAYFGIKGTLTNGVTGELNTDFGPGNGKVERALITVAPYEDAQFSFGYTKVPVGYEQITSSSKIAAVERSIVTRYFIEQYDLGSYMTGIHLGGNVGSFYYKASVTNPTQGNIASNTDGKENELAVSSMMGFKGKRDSFNYDIGIYGIRFGDETKAATDESIVYGGFAKLAVGIFSIEAEGIAGVFDDNATDTKPYGFHVMPVVKIGERFDFVCIYSFLDGDKTKIDISDTFRRAKDGSAGLYDNAQAYYIGGNWFIDGDSLKLTFGYELAGFEVGAASDTDVSGL